MEMDRASWTFVSGYVSAMAGRLMDRRSLMALVQAQTGESIVARLRVSLLFANAQPGERPLDEVESRFRDVARSIVAMCPHRCMETIFLSSHDWRAFRSVGRLRLSGGDSTALRADAKAAEAFEAALCGDTGGSRAYGFAVAGVRIASKASGAAAAAAVDRVCDPYEIAGAVLAARESGSGELARWIETWAGLRAALSLVRARLQDWEMDELYAEWRAAGFGADALNEIAFGAKAGWAPALVRLGLPTAAEALASHAPAASLARMIDDQVTELARGAEGVAFGPEKVFAFLWALKMEAMNLRIVLAAAEAGMPEERFAPELRAEYV